MRYIRIGIIVIFLAMTIVFATNWYSNKNAIDQTYPEIKIGKEQLDVSVKAGKEEFLKDVIAQDAKDGDLTNRVIVESISKFIDKENHICKITYAVADSDNNVTKKTRKIRFTDYESPKFTASGPLVLEMGTDTKPSDIIGAIDDYDGDISGKIKVLSSTISTRTEDEYNFTAQVTNSLGDTAKLKATVVIAQGNNLSPIIELNQYIAYLKVGDKFEPEKYIKSVKDPEGNDISKGKVEVVRSTVNTKKAGFYNVQYSVNQGENNEGSSYLTVVVED